ncbi:SET and MYND domain-containing protein 4-like isoform X2 [Phymastichus coffea]|uniref:SET and MYND domain-containing protein 4-like isoform X2 n=1 Tax=Phymastichus coffea TaxID=108790 RepID=UPI00273CD5B9|nr:SET and MYND domain-containing protein 4-like isoform X2 [Phymastichus coffea]
MSQFPAGCGWPIPSRENGWITRQPQNSLFCKMFVQSKLIQANKYEEYCKKFSNQSDFEHQIKTSIEVLNEIVPLNAYKYECKSTVRSNTLRQKADKLFFEIKGTVSGLLHAWKIYSKSIAYAENNSKELPLAYANRSAILYHLKKYEECVRDINKTLQLSYPDSYRANLIRRKAKCLKLLGKPEADNACQEARKWLENAQLSDNNKEEITKKIQSATKFNMQKSQSNMTRQVLPNIVKNNKIPCASDAVDIKYNVNYGKHIVATRNISVGEVLAIERPYTLQLKLDHIYTHCSHCFARAWDSIPCPNCVYTMYCSELCREEAWKQYHDVECSVKGYFVNMKMNELAPFSLRLALIAIREAGSIEKLEEELNRIDDIKDPLEKCLLDGVYYSDIYRALYCLETHKSERMWPELISLTLNSAIIIYYTYISTLFFGENSDKSIKKISDNPKVIFVAKLIAHHYMTLQMNDHVDSCNGEWQQASTNDFSCSPNRTRIPSTINIFCLWIKVIFIIYNFYFRFLTIMGLIMLLNLYLEEKIFVTNTNFFVSVKLVRMIGLHMEI